MQVEGGVQMRSNACRTVKGVRTRMNAVLRIVGRPGFWDVESVANEIGSLEENQKQNFESGAPSHAH